MKDRLLYRRSTGHRRQIKRRAAILGLLLRLAHTVGAEPEPPPLAEGYSTAEASLLWRKPAAHSRWEIGFERPPPATEGSPNSDVKYRPVRVTVTRHGRDMLQEVLMEDGKCWETWILGQVQIQSVAGNDNVWLKPSYAGSPGASDVTDHHSFGEFQWIRKDHFRGTYAVLGTPAAVYLHPLENPMERALQKLRPSKKGPLAGLPLGEGILAAAIHPQTKHPMILQRDGVLQTYKITPLPRGPLMLPDKVKRFLQYLTSPAEVPLKPLP